MEIPAPAVGAIFASLVAATITLLSLIISKENKTSEFRQAWIDALRSDLAEYLAQINSIADAYALNYDNHEDRVRSLSPLYSTLNRANFNILLRVNETEVRGKRLVAAMRGFNRIAMAEEIELDELRRCETEYMKASRDLLKHEWERVKKGEFTYRVTKFVSLAAIFFAVLFLFLWSMGVHPSEVFTRMKEVGNTWRN